MILNVQIHVEWDRRTHRYIATATVDGQQYSTAAHGENMAADLCAHQIADAYRTPQRPLRTVTVDTETGDVTDGEEA